MKYIIMCGGKYLSWASPRQLIEIYDEPLIQRTIRLLREAGVDDIAISTNLPKVFSKYDVPVINMTPTKYWCDGFYLTNEPTCYIFGDVVFSPNAIRSIVEVQTDDIQFFASAPPFARNYYKDWAEPFAFKVVDTEHFKQALTDVKQLYDKKLLRRNPIAWEIWQVIKGTPINQIDYTNYVVINDYTCDIDKISDVAPIMQYMRRGN